MNCCFFDAHAMNVRIPFRLQPDTKGQPQFQWLNSGATFFTDPFFEETITRLYGLPENVRPYPVTNVAELLAAGKAVDAVLPTAFIFHISRCGSTLLSQLLSLDERCIVLSEVPLLDAILRFSFSSQQSFPEKEIFDAALRLLGQKRTGKEQFLFIKADSWHTMFYGRLREWYPHVPFFLMHRSPREVMRSHLKQKGMHAVPGVIEPQVFGFGAEALLETDLDRYLANVLHAYFEKYNTILAQDKNAFPLSYHDGAAKMVEDVATRCGIVFSESVLSAMQQRGQQHSKDPQKVFSEEKTNAGDAFAFPALEELFQQLQRSRVIG